MYQKTLSRGKFLAKYYFVNFNLIVTKVNFFSWWEGGDHWALIRGWALINYTYLIGWAVIRGGRLFVVGRLIE